MAAGGASNLQLAPPRTAAALVLGGDAALRRETVILLRASGFESIAGDGPVEEREPGVAILLAVGERKPATRVRETVERLAGRPVILVASSDSGGAALRQAVQAGAAGIVEADRLRETLMPTLEAVLAGLLVVPMSARRQLAPRALSYRERQILALVVRGYTNRQIAQELFVAECTVKTHLSSAFAKLETRSRAEAAALLMDPDEGYRFGLPAADGPEDRAVAHR
jgi:DNA-binding NarL/FixJ family response regulator